MCNACLSYIGHGAKLTVATTAAFFINDLWFSTVEASFVVRTKLLNVEPG